MYQIWCRKFDRRKIYAPKTKFKMAAAAILNLFPVAIIGFPLLNATNCQHKNIQNFMNISQSTTQLYYLFKFKMAPVRHVRFSNTWLLTHRPTFPYIVDFSITVQNLLQKIDRCPNYGPKRNSKWLLPPSWIYFRWQFLTYCRLYTITIKNFVQISQSTTEL